jgi:hypothetical protein
VAPRLEMAQARLLTERGSRLSAARIPAVPKSEIRQADQPDLVGPVALLIIFRFSSDPNHLFNPRRLIPQKGRIAIVTNVGMGCGGRGSVVAPGELRGRRSIERRPVSISPARGRTMLLPSSPVLRRSCTCRRSLLVKMGRGRQNRVVLAPVAGAKSAEVLQAQPGSCNIANSPMTVARRIRRRGEYGISR